MSSLAVQPVPPPPEPMRRFTVDEFHRMIDAGILGEEDRVELLEGWLVAKMVHNPKHDSTLAAVNKSLLKRVSDASHIRVQSAITTDDSEPEPDLAVVAGTEFRYQLAHPRSQDIALIIELADSTLRLDQGMKWQLYARAGVLTYWIINLPDRCVEIYTDPTGPAGPSGAPAYRRRQVVIGNASVTLPSMLNPSAEIPLSEIFG